MKKIALLLSLLFIQLMSWAQAGMYFPKYQFEKTDEPSLREFILNYFRDFQGSDFDVKLQFQKSTPNSQHFTFVTTHHGFELLHHQIKLNLNRQNKILSIKYEGSPCHIPTTFNVEELVARWETIDVKAMAKSYWKEDIIIRTMNYKIASLEGNIELVCELNAWDTQYDKTLIIDQKGKVIEAYDNVRHLLIDTMIQCRVFNPDPLTSIGQVYGGLYKDNANANSSWMSPAYVDTVVQATYDTNTQLFYLENPWVKIDSLESLDITVATSTIPEFLYNRSQNGFEDVNAFFHLTNYHNYIAALGYNNYMNQQIQVDSHGQFGADNSVFNRNGGNPNIMYGTGGVDDAEDADVLIHEYSHALSWSANNNGNFSNERAGLDEGLADYFATSYSRMRSSFNWEMMFSWDGHNEFWAGRTANTGNNYPYSGNIYGMGEIWNAAMSGIWTDVGPTITDKLMLEALPFLTNQSTLPEAALYVLQADTVLFNGLHSNTICNRFQSKGIFDANCKPVGVFETTKAENWVVNNSLGFAQGRGALSIDFPKNGSWNIDMYSIDGEHIFSQHQSGDTFTISPTPFPTGLYLIRISNNKYQHTFKVTRW